MTLSLSSGLALCCLALFLSSAAGDSVCGCPNVPGFYLYPKMDHSGDDIQCAPISGRSAFDLGDACRANRFCTSFSMYQGAFEPMTCSKYVGLPVDFAPEGTMRNACHGIYVKETVPTGCPQVQGYSLTSDMDADSSTDIIQVPLDYDRVAAACNADCNCRSFNSKGWLKRSTSAHIPAHGLCFYTKSPSTPSCSSPPPPPSPPVHNGEFVRSVAMGSGHTCALMSSGKVKCWGQNIYGQLGFGSNRAVEGIVTVDLGGQYATDVTAGNYHTCALTSFGKVKCWGLNTNGQLGLGISSATYGTSLSEVGANMPDVNLGNNAVAISAGGMHTCALLQGGTVKCFGLNSFGQLGMGDTTMRGKDSNTMGNALPAVNLGFNKLAIGISTGWFHTCALLLDGGVKCWGFNLFGQLGRGDGSTLNRGILPQDMGDSLPTVTLGGPASSISTNGHHTCARIVQSPQDPPLLKCWGSNKYAELGQGNTYMYGLESGSMYNVPPVNLGSFRSAVMVSPGSSHTCALLDDRSIKCFGFNGFGQLGLERADTPIGENMMGDLLPAVKLGTNDRPESVATGFGSTTCAVLNSGNAIKCWGRNDKGQRGVPGYQDVGATPGDMGNNLPSVNLDTPPRIMLGSGEEGKAPTKGECEVCAELATRPASSIIGGSGRPGAANAPFDGASCVNMATFLASNACGTPPGGDLSPVTCAYSPNTVKVCASGTREEADAWMKGLDNSCANSMSTMLSSCGAMLKVENSCGGMELFTTRC